MPDPLSPSSSKATTDTMDTPDELSAPRSRRGFLKLGGMTVAVSALAAACVQQVKTTDKMAQTGTLIPAPSTSVPPFPGSAALDASYVLTALSIEKLAVETYDMVKDKGWLDAASVSSLASMFRDHHEQHAAGLATIAEGMGQDPGAVQANALVKSGLVDPDVAAIEADGSNKTKTETDTVTLLFAIEDTLGQLYAKSGGEMTAPDLRATMTSIGSPTAQQATALATVLGKPPVPYAFQHTAPAAVVEDAYVKADEKTLRSTGTTPGTTKR